MGYNGRGFFRCGYNGRVFSAEGYNGEGFPLLWSTISGWKTNFFLLYPTTQEIFRPLYPTPQRNLIQCTVSQKNLQHCIPQRRRFSSVVSHSGRYFPPLWDTMEEVFLGYNGKSFPPLWDTTQECFFFVGYNGRGFFLCGIQKRKMIQRRMIF